MAIRNEFEKQIPDDCKEAIKELKRLRIYRLAALDDCIKSFADVWWMVLHELDLYVEDEYPTCDGGLTHKQAERADAWLIKHVGLFNKYRDPGEYGEHEIIYTGQV